MEASQPEPAPSSRSSSTGGRRSSSRRARPNLHLHDIRPLTTQLDADADAEYDMLSSTVSGGAGAGGGGGGGSDGGDGTHTPKSYLSSRSLPQTPSSIISRPQDHHPHHSRSRSRVRLSAGAPGSKSSAAITELTLTESPAGAGDKLGAGAAGSRPRHHTRAKSSGTLHATAAMAAAARASDRTSWMLQTASVLATTSAEGRGQAWLATRSSSTSLADAPARIDGLASPTHAKGGLADEDFLVASPSILRNGTNSRGGSRFGSRVGSRAASRANSRRGSRVGLVTEWGTRTPGVADDDEDRLEGYFDRGVDFVRDEDEEDDGVKTGPLTPRDFAEAAAAAKGEVVGVEVDEGEIQRLVWGRARGWVDWAVGWMDFRVDEEYIIEEGEEGDGVGGAGDEASNRRRLRDAMEAAAAEAEDADAEIEGAAKGGARRARRRPRASTAVRRRRDEILVETASKEMQGIPPPPEDKGVIGDAQWLLSVAKNIIV